MSYYFGIALGVFFGNWMGYTVQGDSQKGLSIGIIAAILVLSFGLLTTLTK